MGLAPKALVGLIAHEIALTLADDRDCRTNATLAENKARGIGDSEPSWTAKRVRRSGYIPESLITVVPGVS
jgi:hypothetical protein